MKIKTRFLWSIVENKTSKAEDTSIIGTWRKTPPLLFQPDISALKRFLFAWNFQNQDLKPCLEKPKHQREKKNQDLALRNQWVDKLLREVVGRKVVTVLN